MTALLKDHASPLLLDGAMGTMLQQCCLNDADFTLSGLASPQRPATGNFDLLNITRPDIVANVHRQYLEAGADIITTNTFLSQRISQARYGLDHEAALMSLHGARIARAIADEYAAKTGRPRYVAGSMGPTDTLLSRQNAEDKAQLIKALSIDYQEQAEALIEGGVDAIIVETAVDALNATAALLAAHRAIQQHNPDVALMLSFSVADSEGRLLSGQCIDALAASLPPIPLFSIGINCSMGAGQMLRPLRLLAAKANCRISACPNAGLPNAQGQYPDSPESMAKALRTCIDEGIADIIGGCCGTTPAHIAAFRKMLDAIILP